MNGVEEALFGRIGTADPDGSEQQTRRLRTNIPAGTACATAVSATNPPSAGSSLWGVNVSFPASAHAEKKKSNGKNGRQRKGTGCMRSQG